MTTKAVFDHLAYPPRARKYLSTRLREGTLVLFLGAGTSMDLGIPGWVDLVNNVRKDLGLTPLLEQSDSLVLQVGADEALQRCKTNEEYFDILRKNLYARIPRLSSDVLKNDLLTAIGALLRGSKRGSIQRVVTLNFDSMLEWFLSLNGCVVRVVSHFPELEGSEDVRVYHPYGFLPHVSMSSTRMIASKSVILGSDSVNLRLGTLGESSYEAMRNVLRTGVCLFVGLSERTFSDPSLAPLLAKTADEVWPQRPVGIWLSKHRMSDTRRKSFLNRGLVSVEFASKGQLADFLLEICQEAAASWNPSVRP